MLCLLFVGAISFGYFSWKIGKATQFMSIIPQKSTPISDTIHGAQSLLTPLFPSRGILLPGETIEKETGEKSGRMNILLLGKANEKTAGQKLTDTIMIASLDFKRKKIALLSLPRDLFVEVPGKNFSTKLNAIYQIDLREESGAEIIKETVSNITGLPIHAFLILDYDGFIQTVDLLGGISVYVERDLFDPRFPGPNYSYETFEIKKGWQDLDGATALKYARERHADPEGDFGRATRQQAILSALKNKSFSMKTLLDPFAISGIIEILGTHIRTDLSLETLQHLAARANEFDTKNIATAVVDAWKKDSLLRVSHVQVGNVAMFVLLPRTGDWSQVQELAENIFDLDRLNARRTALKEEAAHVALINESEEPLLGSRIVSLLSENLGIRHAQVITLPSPDNEGVKENERAFRETSLLISQNGTAAFYTADEIVKKLSIQVSESKTIDSLISLPSPSSLPSLKILEKSDLVILLGNDLAKKLSFEEDEIEDIQNAENDPEYQKQLDAVFRNQSSTDLNLLK